MTLVGFSSAAKQFAEGKPLRLLAVETLIRESDGAIESVSALTMLKSR